MSGTIFPISRPASYSPNNNRNEIKTVAVLPTAGKSLLVNQQKNWAVPVAS
jgi:hypothetical protein